MQNKRQRKGREMPAYNNQVFVACAARTMKTQLNETGQVCTIYYYGHCDEKGDFSASGKETVN
jgi:hypothetical protein